MKATTQAPTQADKAKQALIGLSILDALAETGSMRLAYNKVMGEGAYEKLASDLYDEIKAKQAH
jgi:hypothetical protein